MEHQYREVQPPPELAAYLACFWTETTGDREGEPPVRVLPDGCVDVVWQAGALPVVVGPAVHAVLPAIPPGSTLVGARFRPGMAPVALDVPASALVHAEVPLADLWGREQARHERRFDDSRSPDDGFAVIRRLLHGRLARGAEGDAPIAVAARWLMQHPAARLDRLPALTDLSERQLRRRFEAAIGYGPKTFQRIARFQRWQRLSRQAPPERRSLSDLAAAAGYADQSHLTREVTRMAGLSPAALLAASEA